MIDFIVRLPYFMSAIFFDFLNPAAFILTKYTPLATC